MNRLDSYHTFNYNGSMVTWESGYSWAWARSATGWYISYGPTFNFSSYSLPRSSDWAKAYASYRNNSFPGGPYANSISTYTYVYGNGNVNASHNFYIDPKGFQWYWRASGWHTRTQIY